MIIRTHKYWNTIFPKIYSVILVSCPLLISSLFINLFNKTDALAEAEVPFSQFQTKQIFNLIEKYISDNPEIVLRALEKIQDQEKESLTKEQKKQVDQNRVAAFAKRLAGTTLASEAGEAVGALGVARQLLAAYPKTRCLLENEKVGVGAFDPNLDDPETCVGLAAVLWDLSLLRSHYHPAVAAAASEVAGMPLQGAVATALGSHAPAELARLHSTTRGTFRPAIPPPRVGKKAKTSPLDRASGKGKRGERAVLDLGPELRALVEGTAHDENANAKGSGGGGGGGGADEAVVDALRRHFLETKAFAVNGELRKEATRLRRMTQKAKAHAHERAAAAAAAAAAKKKKKKETSAAGGKKRSKAAKAA